MDEIKSLIEAQGRAFDEFKASNDELLKAKADGKAVAELEEKTDRLNERLGDLASQVEKTWKKANRLAPGAADGASELEARHRKAYSRWLRTGDDSLLNALRKDGSDGSGGSGGSEGSGGSDGSDGSGGSAGASPRAINVGTQAEGGYAAPIQQDRTIMRLLRDASPMRQVCRVVTIGAEDYRKLVNLGGADSGWVGETDSRPQTNTPQFASISPYFGEIYANPGVTQKALDDLFYDVEGELAQDIATEFAEKEGIAFLTGNGSSKPKGLLAYSTAATADGSRDFGVIQHLVTGQASALPSSNPGDKLLDMIYALKSGYRQNARWMMNSSTLAAVRKWKDGQSNYLWQPSAQLGQPGSLFGYPLVTNEDCDSVAANAFPILFGDFQRAYWIFDRIGIRSLRDPYTNKPYVMFYTTKRVGGMLVDSQAVKVLKVAAS